MTDPSYTGKISGTMIVTEEIRNAHPKHVERGLDYPLLPGDMLVKWEDGTWYKFGPGLGVFGFVLTSEQEATLTPQEGEADFAMGNLQHFAEAEGLT